MFDWLRNLLSKAKSKVSATKITVSEIVGYYNGECPNCKTHIGTDVQIKGITRKVVAYCGHCGQDIYSMLDKSKIVMHNIE